MNQTMFPYSESGDTHARASTHTKSLFLPYQSTVNGDSLTGSLSSGSGAFEPLRTSQVHKVEFSHQCFILWLFNGTGFHTV